MKPRYWWFLLSLVFVFGLALRVYQLGEESLWFDEICHADAASKPTWKEMFDYDFTVKVLYTPLNDSLMRLCGLKRDMGEFAWRLPSAILGSLSVPLLGVALRGMFGPALGLASAFALAVAPYHIEKASQEVNVYGLLGFACTAALATFVLAFEKGGVLRWLAFLFCVTLVLYAHMLSVFFCCWFAAWACLYAGWRRFRRDRERTPGIPALLRKATAAVLAVGAGGAIFFPWLYFIGIKAGAGKSGNWKHPGMLDVFRFASPLFGRSPVTVSAFLILCVLGALLLWRHRSTWTGFVYGWVLTAIPVFAVFWFNKTIPYPQYQLILLLALCMLAAQGALAIGAAGRRLLGWISARGAAAPGISLGLACCLLVGFAAPDLKRLYTDHPRKEPWRQMSAYLGQQAAEDDVVVCSPPWSLFCMEYYQARLPRPLYLVNWDALMTMSKPEERALRARNGRIWFATRGYLPEESNVEGCGFGQHAVYRRTGQTTRTADFLAVADELAERGGASDLVLLSRARALDARKDYPKLIALLEPRLEEPVSTLEISWLLGTAYQATGQTDKAVDVYRTYAPLSDKPWYWEGRALKALAKAGQHKRALEEGAKFLEQYPEDPLMAYELARSAEAVGDFQTAYRYFVENARRNPDNPYALRCCALYHLNRGKLDEAEAMFQRGLELAPGDDPEMYLGLAQVHEKRGNPAEAKTVLQRGITLSGNPELVLELARLLLKDGEKVQAAALLKTAIARHPGHIGLKTTLQEAERPAR